MCRRSSAAIARVALPLLMLAGASCGDAQKTSTRPHVEIRGQRVEVEIAKTREEQRQGLSDRDRLPWDRGMLFLYEEPGFYAFWMKDMRFDIDIVWIRDRRIVHIHHRVPRPNSADGPVPRGQLPRYQPPELADRVLEVPAGYAQAHGWRRGDWVELEAGPD